MPFVDEVNAAIADAMRRQNAPRLSALRMLKAALMNREVERGHALDDGDARQVVASLVKQRRDSIEQFTKGNRPELAAKEAAEITVIEEFLPKALDEAGLRALVSEVISEYANAAGHAPTPKDMGPIMKAVQTRLQQSGARAEGRVVSDMVKQSLGG